MNKVFMLAIISFTLFALSNCTKNPAQPNVNDPVEETNSPLDSKVFVDPMFNPIGMPLNNETQASQAALLVVPGTVSSVIKTSYRGIMVWDVTIIINGNAKVHLKLDVTYGFMISINSDTSAIFKYDINPVKDFLKLSQIISIIKGQLNGHVINWSIVYGNKHHWLFIVNFMPENSMSTITFIIKAKGGKVLQDGKGYHDDDGEDDD